jgi:CRP-like cAMP-binding protein
MAQDKLAIISSCHLFRGLDAEVLRQISAAAYTRSYSEGALIHQKGAQPEGLFAIVKGKAKVSSIAPDGREMLFTILESGEWFGEVALFDGQVRSHDVYAVGATEFLVVPNAEFHRILQQKPDLYPHFFKLLCKYIRMSFSALEDKTFLDLPARLVKRLFILEEGFGVTVPEGVRINLHLPQEELARMLGASRQSVCTELNKWEKNGWIQQRYGRMLIKDRKALEQLLEK